MDNFRWLTAGVLIAAGCSQSGGDLYDAEAEGGFDSARFVSTFEDLVEQVNRTCACKSPSPDQHYDARMLLDLESQFGLRFDEWCAFDTACQLELVVDECRFVPHNDCKLMYGAKVEGQSCSVIVDSIDDCARDLRCDVEGSEASGGVRRGVCRSVGEDYCYANYECASGVCGDTRCIPRSEQAELGEKCDGRFCKAGLRCETDTEFGPVCKALDACDALPSPTWAMTGHSDG